MLFASSFGSLLPVMPNYECKVCCVQMHCCEPDVKEGLLHRYDDLRNYSNERSLYLAQLRHSIEKPWQQWESSHFDIESYKSKTVEQVL